MNLSEQPSVNYKQLASAWTEELPVTYRSLTMPVSGRMKLIPMLCVSILQMQAEPATHLILNAHMQILEK
nr:hypothetical protein [Paenibacillus larvae]